MPVIYSHQLLELPLAHHVSLSLKHWSAASRSIKAVGAMHYNHRALRSTSHFLFRKELLKDTHVLFQEKEPCYNKSWQEDISLSRKQSTAQNRKISSFSDVSSVSPFSFVSALKIPSYTQESTHFTLFFFRMSFQGHSYQFIYISTK